MFDEAATKELNSKPQSSRAALNEVGCSAEDDQKDGSVDSWLSKAPVLESCCGWSLPLSQDSPPSAQLQLT